MSEGFYQQFQGIDMTNYWDGVNYYLLKDVNNGFERWNKKCGDRHEAEQIEGDFREDRYSAKEYDTYELKASLGMPLITFPVSKEENVKIQIDIPEAALVKKTFDENGRQVGETVTTKVPEAGGAPWQISGELNLKHVKGKVSYKESQSPCIMKTVLEIESSAETFTELVIDRHSQMAELQAESDVELYLIKYFNTKKMPMWSLGESKIPLEMKGMCTNILEFCPKIFYFQICIPQNGMEPCLALCHTHEENGGGFKIVTKDLEKHWPVDQDNNISIFFSGQLLWEEIISQYIVWKSGYKTKIEEGSGKKEWTFKFNSQKLAEYHTTFKRGMKSPGKKPESVKIDRDITIPGDCVSARAVYDKITFSSASTWGQNLCRQTSYVSPGPYMYTTYDISEQPVVFSCNFSCGYQLLLNGDELLTILYGNTEESKRPSASIDTKNSYVFSGDEDKELNKMKASMEEGITEATGGGSSIRIDKAVPMLPQSQLLLPEVMKAASLKYNLPLDLMLWGNVSIEH